MATGVLFEEKQAYSNVWLWICIIMVTMGLLIPLTWSFATQWSTAGTPGRHLEIGLAALMAYGSFAAMYWLLFLACLRTRIEKDGLWYQFPPFIRSWRHIPKDQIRAYKIGRRHPTGNFGKSGLHYGKKGRSLHVKGNHELKVEYGAYQKLVIGTQKPKSLDRALKEMMREKTEIHVVQNSTSDL